MDTFNILQDFRHLTGELDAINFDRNVDSILQGDLIYRSHSMAASTQCWHLAYSDIPRQLGEGMPGDVPAVEGGSKIILPELSDHMLSHHPRYRDSVMVRDPFRCFDGGDGTSYLSSNRFNVFHTFPGYILTMSAASGVNLLGKDLQGELEVPTNYDPHNESNSVIGYLRTGLEKYYYSNDHFGWHKWEKEKIEWFLVYLITELEPTPFAGRWSRDLPEIQAAYAAIVQDLVRLTWDWYHSAN
jgi:hypothetical protein